MSHELGPLQATTQDSADALLQHALIQPHWLRIDTPAWTGHIPFAAWLVAATKPRLLVELGTHAGVSYSAFCQAVEQSKLQTACYAVDTWQGDEHTGAYTNEVYESLRQEHVQRYAGFSQLLRTSFDDALAYFSDGSIDLLHIDGFHTYEAVKHDFETWAPKLSSRAIVLFHDCAVRERDFGVWRFFEEVRDQYPWFEFRHSHGLGVLCIGSDAPVTVVSFCKSPGYLGNYLLPHLGNVLSRQVEAIRVATNLADINRQLSQSNSAASNMGETIRSLVLDRDALRTGVAAIEQRYADLEAQSKAHIQSLSEALTSVIEDRDARTSGGQILQQQIADLRQVHEQQLKDISTAHCRQVADLIAVREADTLSKLSTANAQHELDLKALLADRDAQHLSQLKAAQGEYMLSLAALRETLDANHLSILNAAQAQHALSLAAQSAELDANHRSILREAQAEHERSQVTLAAKLVAEHLSKLDEVQNQHTQSLTALREELSANHLSILTAARTQHALSLKALRLETEAHRLSQLKVANDRHELSLRALTDEINVVTEQLAAATSTTHDQSKLIDVLTGSLNSAQVSFAEVSAVNGRQAQQLVEMSQSVVIQREATRHWQSVATDLFGSTSWKLTKPVRLLSRYAQRVRSTIFNAESKAATAALQNNPTPPSPVATVQNSAVPAQEAIVVRPSLLISAPPRILLVCYYCPSRAHAGGLRILDLYQLIKTHRPEAQIHLLTHRRPEIDWAFDDALALFDRVFLAPTEDLSPATFASLAPTEGAYDVIDLQFHQTAAFASGYRKLGKKIIFTPMESLAKSLFMELRQASNSHSVSAFFKTSRSFKLASEEIGYCAAVDEVVCVSRSDAAFLRSVVSKHAVRGIDTGVSMSEFREALQPDHICPSSSSKPMRVVYVAYFGSDTNVQALKWFLADVHPKIKEQVPEYILAVVGRGDMSSFDGYRNDPHIEFVGQVSTLAPEIERARVGIAPALSGSGLRGKVNQYAIMGVPCVVSPISHKGLAYKDGESIFVAETASAFAQSCCDLLVDEQLNTRMAEAARKLCLDRYSWESKWPAIQRVYNLETSE